MYTNPRMLLLATVVFAAGALVVARPTLDDSKSVATLSETRPNTLKSVFLRRNSGTTLVANANALPNVSPPLTPLGPEDDVSPPPSPKDGKQPSTHRRFPLQKSATAPPGSMVPLKPCLRKANTVHEGGNSATKKSVTIDLTKNEVCVILRRPSDVAMMITSMRNKIDELKTKGGLRKTLANFFS